MADAIVSIAIERLATILEEKIREEINLVRGVKKELGYLSSELTTIRKVLDDAETRGYKDKSIQHWLKKLEDISHDVDDVLDEWNFALLKQRIEGSEELDVPQPKVSSFIPCSCLSFKQYAGRRDIAVKIKGLKERLEVIVKEKDQYDFVIKQSAEPQGSKRNISVSLVNELYIHGRDAEKDALVRKLIFVGQNEFGPTIISIVGTGGIGKTTLAQLAYNDPQVINSFELKIWVCVSDVFNHVKIAEGIVGQIMRENPPSTTELEALLNRVRDHISGKRFLLVLDDVWTEDYKKWEPFKSTLDCGGPGSKILVTTRSERVARVVGTTEIHRLGLLCDGDCWLLMRHMAFSGRSEVNYEEFEEIGEKIAKKCKGLPLAAKFLGSLLCFKDSAEEWENILRSEIWQLEEAEVSLFPHLFLSYNELSPAMKRCFSYCAMFPKDSVIDTEKLIGMWMAQGYLSSTGGTGDLELRGKVYFDNLRMRSFFQDFNESYDGSVACKMHDIVHDFAHFLRKTTDHIQEDTTPSSISQVKVYRTLEGQVGDPPYQLESVTCLRVLSYEYLSMDECDWEEFWQFIEKLIHLRYLTLSAKDLPSHQFFQTICKLYNLQRLDLSYFVFEEVPKEIGNLIHLRHLDLSDNFTLEQLPETICNLQELRTLNLASCNLSKLPQGIGNLIRLRQLDLSVNRRIRELPETICNLQELRTLNLFYCSELFKLPEGIHRLINLKHLHNGFTGRLNQIPQGLEQLSGLQTLNRLPPDTKLGCLKKLDQLSGSLELEINIYGAEDVMEAKKANLRNKKHIEILDILFRDQMSESDDDNLIRNDIMESLQVPPFLQSLKICFYPGTKFPGWITSSLNQLRVLEVEVNLYCSTLPPLGKLPSLEEFSANRMDELRFLNREFLGIPAAGEIETSFDVVIVGFPKLRKLTFYWCPEWKLWEDITDEEAANDNLSIMPCLTKLCILDCHSLTTLPHRILRKASTLEHLEIAHSPDLSDCYKDKDGSGRRSLSHIQNFEVLVSSCSS